MDGPELWPCLPYPPLTQASLGGAGQAPGADTSASTVMGCPGHQAGCPGALRIAAVTPFALDLDRKLLTRVGY